MQNRLTALLLSWFLCGLPAGSTVKSSREWPVTGGDPGGTRYSTLDQINRSNVRKLRVAWIYHTGDKSDEPKTTIECTPIVVDGVMYVTSPRLKLIALDASSGKHLWTYDPFPAGQGPSFPWYSAFPLIAVLGISRAASKRWMKWLRPLLFLGAGVFALLAFHGIPGVLKTEKLDPWRVNRGVAFWREGGDRRILFAADHTLIALKAETGKPIPEFGSNGSVDLRQGLERELGKSGYMVTSPGVIYQNLIIVGSKTGEGPRPEAPGHVRAYDVRTGQRKWIFHTIPQPGEFGYETWPPEAWKTAAGTNDWAGMTVDEKRGLVFLAIGSPTFDYYGGDRHGKNLFGDSVVALNAATGKRVWHFQAVHHDLWDYDLPCPPILVTVHHNGRPVDAVAQLTKMGYVFLLDRETGEPLLPIEERAVPASGLPGEQAWPTQPYPVKPPPFSRHNLTEADLTDLSPKSHASALRQFRTLKAGPIFSPPSKQGTIIFPGFHGGANWSGGSFDPSIGTLFVNSNEIPYILSIVDSKLWHRLSYPFDFTGFHKFQDDEGYPAVKPPWGKLSSIDLNKGEIVWQVPLGEYKELTAKGVPATGTENFGGSIVTAGGLVFIGGTRDEKFRAFDQTAGTILWEAQLEAGGYATPATYEVNGKQYVAIAAGGAGQLETKPGDAYVAFALP